MNAKILRSRNKSVVAIIFIVIFLLPVCISDYTVFVRAATENGDDNYNIAAKKTPIDSTNITELTYWDDNYGTIVEVVVEGNYAYIALGANGFIIVDVSDVEAPRVVAEYDTYTCNHIFVDNDIIYFTNNSAVNILDASDFSNFVLMCNFTVFSGLDDIVVSGNFVHLTSNSYYHIYNITDYLNPAQTDFYTQGGLYQIKLIGNIVYLEDTDNVRVLNVTDVTSIDYLDDIYQNDLTDFDVEGNFIYTSCYDNSFPYNNDEVIIWNATTLTTITSLSTYELNFTASTSTELKLSGNHLIVNDGSDFEIIDISNKSQPLYYALHLDTFEVNDFCIVGDNLFAWNGDDMKILDISDLADFVEIWVDQYDGYSYHVYLDGIYAYVADGTNLQIVNVEDPVNPIEVGHFFDENGDFEMVHVHNGFAYILEDSFGLRIVDVSDPTNPVERGNYTLGGDYIQLCANDEYVFIASVGNGLRIIDIYYPDYPQQSLLYQEVGDVYDVEIVENTLYLACGEYLQIVDITNPYEPEPISNYTRSTSFYIDVEVTEDYLYALSAGEGFDIIDIATDITAPAKIGQYFTYNSPGQIKVDGEFIYLLDDSALFEVFDATNIVHPKKIGEFDEITVFNSFTVRNGYIFVASGFNGTHVLTTNPLLTVKSPFLGPLAFFVGLSIFSIVVLFIRKKKRR